MTRAEFTGFNLLSNIEVRSPQIFIFCRYLLSGKTINAMYRRKTNKSQFYPPSQIYYLFYPLEVKNPPVKSKFGKMYILMFHVVVSSM